MKLTALQFIFFITIVTILFSCKKQDEFLDKKNSLSNVVPASLKDFQALLDDDYTMNLLFPTIGQVGADNLFVTDNKYLTLDDDLRNTYNWTVADYISTIVGDWDMPYAMIEKANIVLDGLDKIKTDQSNADLFNNVKGSALFFRGLAYYLLAQNFCKPFDSITSQTDLGMVIRLNSDVNVKSVRSSVKATYDQMIQDMKNAADLLPIAAATQTRPSKPAVNGFLAKIYLSMGDYTNAALYSGLFLSQFNYLIDFNDILPGPRFPFPQYSKNNEINFFATGSGVGYTFTYATNTVSNVDTLLYNSYDSNDLRKTLFYVARPDSSISFRGSYSGKAPIFSGIATNEILLIHAESSARLGKLEDANNDLNTLLQKRWKTGTYTNINITDPLLLLQTILKERRKELPLTSEVRWEDLRRLNKDPRFAITIKRFIQGELYELQPNDPKYVLPIPGYEIQLSNIQQNPR